MNKKEFQQKMIPFTDKAYRMAFRFLQNEHEAEDVVQDIFLKLWKMRDQLAEVKNNESYIISLIKRHCIDKIRHQNVKQRHNSSITELNFNNIEHDNSDRKEMFKEVNNTIETLPELQKQIITLRDVEGFSYEEIADITGLTINNLRVSLSRIRKSIKDIVNKKFAYGLRKNK